MGEHSGVIGVRGMAVAMGLGAAVLSGWGAGTAWAEDGASPSAAESAPAAGAEPKADPTAKKPPAHRGPAALGKKSDADDAEPAAARPPNARPGVRPHRSLKATPTSATAVLATTPADPKPVRKPKTPAAQSQLAAPVVSRRELQARPDLPTTAQSAPVATAEVADSITHTGPPTLIDRVTVAALRVVRVVSKIIGVDLYGQIGKLIASANPPFFVKFGLDVRKTEFEASPGNTWKVWEFTPPEPSGKTVVAVHGGGFILQPNLLHWIDYSNMARQTGATVVVPIYPLATTDKGTAVTVVPAMADYIANQVAAHGAENVSVYADSAGPNLALGALREMVQRGDALPARMVLISFTPDLSLSNPDLYTTDDPIIDINDLGFYSTVNHWGDGLDPRDPMMSPLFIEPEVLRAFPQTTVYIGSLEYMLPDMLLFQQKAVSSGAPFSLVIGDGQFHDWPIGGLPINSQAPKVRRDIYRELGLLI